MNNKKMTYEHRVMFYMIGFMMLIGLVVFGILYETGEDNHRQYNLSTISLEQEDVMWEQVDGYRKVIVQGTLASDISAKSDVMLYVQYLDVKLYVDGESVYENHMNEKNQGKFMWATEGWENIESTGWIEGCQIRLELVGVYNTLADSVFERCMNSFTYGNYGDLVKKIHAQNRFEIIFGLIVFSSGLLIMVCSLVMFLLGSKYMLKVSANGLLIVSVALWYLIEAGNDYWEMIISNDVLYNFIDVYIVFLMPVVISFYFSTMLKNRRYQKIATWCIAGQVIFDIVLLVLSNLQCLKLFYAQWMVVFLILVAAIIVLMYIKEVIVEYHQFTHGRRIKQQIWVLVSFLPWAIGGIFQYLNFIIHFTNFHDFFQVGILVSMFLQIPTMGMIIYDAATKERELERTKRELEESRTKIMVSQIQPHFIFNSLGSIKRLYDIDHDRAKEAMEKFTRYLRENINSLSNEELVPFSTELEHLNNYLYLEKLRFQDRIQIEYDIEFEKFYLPVLTIQPIVENAIKHGITEKREGGTVRIRVRREMKYVHIYIEDDGIGFDMKEYHQDGTVHVGMDNVRNRIENMCNGSMKITSEKGIGTKVEIVLSI